MIRVCRSCLLLLFLVAAGWSEEAKTAPLPAGMKGDFESIDAKVEQVFHHSDGEFRYVAYQITYRGSAVVVPVMFPRKIAEVGATVNVMVNRIEVPQNDKPPLRLLQFLVMDFAGLGE